MARVFIFTPNISDAYEWRGSEAILHSVIKLAEGDLFFDIDSEEGMKTVRKVLEVIRSNNWLLTKSAEQNQCAVMNAIWQSDPRIKVMAASFPVEKTKFPMVMDPRKRRREFCVRNNSVIRCTQLIRKEDLDD